MKRMFARIAFFAIACMAASPAWAYGDPFDTPPPHVAIPSASGDRPGTQGMRWGLMCDSPAALEELYNGWMDTKDIAVQDYVMVVSDTMTAGKCWWAGPTPVEYQDRVKIFRPSRGPVFRIDLYIRLDTGEMVYQFDEIKKRTPVIFLFFKK